MHISPFTIWSICQAFGLWSLVLLHDPIKFLGFFFVKLCINSCHLIFFLIAELKAQRPDHDKEQKFDSNCITPGTPFMVNLGKTLRFWVAKKLNEDPGWMSMKVILSDGSVPGEGEHKMMNFIRSQRSAPHHNPNTSHVIYGLVCIQVASTTLRRFYSLFMWSFNARQRQYLKLIVTFLFAAVGCRSDHVGSWYTRALL